MREIKFRAWLIDEKRMVTDKQDFIPLRVTNFGLERLNPTMNNNHWSAVDTPVELMQYTGLKDKNGKEVYEGDLVIFLDEEDLSNPSNGTYFEEYQNIGKVFYDEELAAYDITNRDCDRDDAFFEIEIIGNIHENKELLDNAK